MPNPTSEPKQPTEATSARAGWLTRAQVAAELGYRSIFPIPKMEGTKLHHGRELREIVEELEVPPGVVRDLWHAWMIDLGEGEMIRNKTADEDRRRRAEEQERRDLERRSDQEQRNFETTMATIAASIAGGNKK